MEKRNSDSGFNRRSNFVHCIGAEHHNIGTSTFKALSGIGEHNPSFFPRATLLEFLDLGEVNGEHHALCRV